MDALGPNRGTGSSRKTSIPRPGPSTGVDLELEHHIAERIDDLVAHGWSHDDARAEAERRFGTRARYRAELLAETGRDTSRRWMRGGLDGVLQDVRYALRGIRRNPAFALTLITTLALGIGATGGVFSVLDAVMLRPLPFLEPERIVEVELFLEDAGVYLTQLQTSQVATWRERADFLADVATHDRVSVLRTDLAQADELGAIAASDNLDEVLGVHAALGRLFGPDDVAEDRRVVVLTWNYWNRLGADPGIVGSTMELDDQSWTVVGVLARGVKYPIAGTSELWIPLGADGSVLGRTHSQTGVLGRLPDGVALALAQERADALGRQLNEAQPTDLGWQVRLSPLGARRANDDTARGLWMVGGAGVLMLLISLVNGINLLLVRGQSRIAEVGVRKAVGASRGRVIRQVMIEAVLLSLGAGIAATWVAWAGVHAIGSIAPREVTFWMVHDFGIEGRALAVVFAVAALSGLLVGIVPGLRLAGTEVAGAGAADAHARDRSGARLRAGLVVVEVAVSVVLLVGAGLFLRSFAEMNRVDLGMRTESLAFLTVELPDSRYPDGAARGVFVESFLPRLEALPGVESVSFGMGAPPEGGGISFGSSLRAEGGEPVAGDNMIPFVTAGPGYLATLGAELVAGRDLVPADRETDGVIIDRDLARQLFGGEPAVGRRFSMDADADEVDWLTVVGVVDELVLGGPDNRTGDGALLYSLNVDAPSSYLVFIVRTTGDPATALGPMRSALGATDDRLPVVSLQTGAEAVGEALSRPRFVMLLMSIMALLALTLAAVGVYGVVSFSVRERRREMGIRIALGAPLSRVRRAVVTWGLAMGVLGTALGLGAALLLDGFAEALLFEVQPGDRTTMVSVAVAMLLVTVVASLVPARRATRVDPIEVLKAN